MFRLSKSFFNRSFVQVVVAGLFLLFLIYFIRNEHLNTRHFQEALSKANPIWIAAGIIITGLYLLLQALLYVYSFKSIGISIGLKSALRLYLKRNFVSTFLPAGTFTSLAFFTDELDKYKLEKAQIHYGSFLFALASMISIVLIAIPALGILLLNYHIRSVELQGIILLTGLIALFLYAGYSLIKQNGIAFRVFSKISPRFVTQIRDLSKQPFLLPVFIKACLISFSIELVGVIHLYIALAALGLQPSPVACLIGYVVMIIILSISPFLRGLGAIEVSVTYVLTLFGYPTMLAASVTLLFRVFEFWLPFFISISVFLLRKGNLLLRIFPAFFIFLLGVVNIISALTPAIPERLRLLSDFIPFSITQFSNVAILLLGLVMMIASAFLLTGARNAWQMAMVVSALSLIGHLTKAIDYEEALVALLSIGILWYTRKAYFVRYDVTFQLKTVQKVIILLMALFMYSIAGFYLLHARHMDFDFSWSQSFHAALKAMTFMTDTLIPRTKTGHFFLYSIQFGSALVIAYGFFSFYGASGKVAVVREEDRALATDILERWGTSSMDYFKLCQDKQFFFGESKDSFLSYSESKHYAVVLENPVGPNLAAKSKLLLSFENYCAERGLRNFYYRVMEEDLSVYSQLKKQSIILGQEAIVDLINFSLEGAAKKSMRNVIRKIENSGIRFNGYNPPLKDGLLQQLRAVSDEWLEQEGHSEAGFSQGVFNADELKKCTVLTVENAESKVLAFLNIVPSYKTGEITYDLIRKCSNSPNGVLDYLIIKMIAYSRDNEFKTLNMGLAPMAGVKGVNMNEQIMQFYRDHFKQASSFKGLFDYKNKFEPRWENRYLVYDQTFDLVRFPLVLHTVTKMDD